MSFLRTKEKMREELNVTLTPTYRAADTFLKIAKTPNYDACGVFCQITLATCSTLEKDRRTLQLEHR